MHKWIFNRKDYYRVFSFFLQEKYYTPETSFSKDFLPIIRGSETLIVGSPIEAAMVVKHIGNGAAMFDVVASRQIPVKAWLAFCKHMSQYREVVTFPKTEEVAKLLDGIGFVKSESGEYRIKGEELTGRSK